jgi:hypothetical protein
VGVDTRGYKGWWEVKEHMGRSRGVEVYKESFRNMVTGELYTSEKGWNGSPPTPTGELITLNHGTNYKDNFGLIEWDSEVSGEVVESHNNRTIIKY